MARSSHGSILRRVAERLRGNGANLNLQDVRRIEERHRTAQEATQRWLSLLRDMEHAGQSGDARYDSYYQAYLKAKQQQKLIELELFNRRQRLSG